MDNVTHTLFGVTMARAGLQRLTPSATLLLILSANIPDIDIVALAGGPLAYLETHRGYTHTFLALPFLALLCVGLTALLTRKKLPFGAAWLVACLGVGSHLLLDWTNSYGVRPFLPFSSQWFYLDLNALYDVVIIAALLLALFVPWFGRLIESEIGARNKHRGQASAIAALLFLVLFDAARLNLHDRAVAQLNAESYDGDDPVKVAALPGPFNPLHWRGVVETETAYRLVPVNVFQLQGGTDSRVFYKPARSKDYLAVMQTEPFRYMAYFSRFPVWGEEPVDIDSALGKRLDLTDLRFGTPGEGSFHAIATLTPNGQIVGSYFTFDLARSEAKAAKSH